MRIKPTFEKGEFHMLYEASSQEQQYPIRGTIMAGNLPFMNHCHEEMEILKVQQGILRMTVEGQDFTLSKGDICIVPPFGSHSIEKSSQDCRRLAILLDLKLMGSQMKENCEWMWVQEELGKLDLCSLTWTEETRLQAADIIEKIYKEIQTKDFAWQLAVKTSVCQLMLLALRRMPHVDKKQQSGQLMKLKDILEYIALNYCSNLTLGSCADAIGFNSTYLSRYFSKHMGITFQEYVKRLRIDKAKWLLMEDRFPVTEVCFQAGFHDVKTFNKLFKSECGMSPTQFRKSR